MGVEAIRHVKEQPTTEEMIARGEEARRILESRTFQAALEEAEFRNYVKWVESDSPEVRERCHALVNALEEIQRALRVFVNDGEVEENRLRQAQ